VYRSVLALNAILCGVLFEAGHLVRHRWNPMATKRSLGLETLSHCEIEYPASGSFFQTAADDDTRWVSAQPV
jgi:hypothetical protein